MLDEEGRYLEILTSQENLLYADVRELKGRLLHEVLPQEAADLFLGVVHSTLSTGQSQVIEYPLDVQGGRRYFEGRTAPLPEPRGRNQARAVSRFTAAWPRLPRWYPPSCTTSAGRRRPANLSPMRFKPSSDTAKSPSGSPPSRSKPAESTR